MTTSLIRPFGVPNHSRVDRVECDSLASELRQHLLSARSKDQRVIQLRKDVQQLKNKAPETIASILSDAFNRGDDIGERFAATIRGFFSTRVAKMQRRLRDLMQVETVQEGEFNNVQMKIAQGDLSRPTLMEMKKEIGEYRAILDEMDVAIDAEMFRVPDKQA
jgi:predicted nucleotidyltransferase